MIIVLSILEKNFNRNNLSDNVSDYTFDAKNNFYITNKMFDTLKKPLTTVDPPDRTETL